MLDCLVGIAAALLVGASSTPPPLALRGLDPVEMTRGREVAADSNLAVERWTYRYAFASEENRAEFLADPERYEIQLGGACARMGPASGLGLPELFGIYDGRIYLFASIQCRQSFQRNPEIYLDPEDPPVDGSPDALNRGREWIERAVAAHGGAARIDGLRALLSRDEWVEAAGDERTRRTEQVRTVFPHDIRIDSSWDDWGWTTVLRQGEAFEYAPGEVPAVLHATARREHERRLARHPLAILRARTRSDFRAVSVGRASDYGDGLDHVAVSYAGTRQQLALDPATGRIVEIAYRGRGPRYAFGTTRWTYSDFRELEGLVLPFTRALEFEGKRDRLGVRTTTLIEIDSRLPGAIFDRPPR